MQEHERNPLNHDRCERKSQPKSSMELEKQNKTHRSVCECKNEKIARLGHRSESDRIERTDKQRDKNENVDFLLSTFFDVVVQS